ncbi:hypothetical protein [Paraburkholderia sp. MM6662-R1]|uniref:hypothetical protein n=1 Tax=Paraburkholderia sp. MM6662-R1 TaxID=2991066 RepID=UPI003D225DE8
MSSTGQPPRAVDRCAWRAALVGYLIVNRWNGGGKQAMAHLLLNPLAGISPVKPRDVRNGAPFKRHFNNPPVEAPCFDTL